MAERVKELRSGLHAVFRRLDKPMFLLVLAALCFGFVIQYSEMSAGFITRRSMATQLIAGGIGAVAMLLTAELDYRQLAAGWRFHLPVTLGLTLLTFTSLPVVYRPEGSDDSAWLRLGIFSLQPGELLKFSFILTLAWHLDRVQEQINHPKTLLLLCLHGAAPCVLIFLQGDMGSALIFFLIFVSMIFVSGLSWKYLALGFGCAVGLSPVVWILLPDYLKNRFLVLGDLENASLKEAYQQLMGRRILGSGMSFGKGLFSNDFTYVYAIENDLVMAHIGQALGFVGAACALLLLTVICGKILLIARSSRDYLGCSICTGVFAMIFFQSALNIGMVLGLLPVIGVTLPFFSQGGSSLAVSCLSVGLVLSVSAADQKRRGRRRS